VSYGQDNGLNQAI
jgi:peptide chain release factor subunit 1